MDNLSVIFFEMRDDLLVMLKPVPGRRGFTLIEALAVLVVLASLLALAAPSVGAVRDRARSLRCQAAIGSTNTLTLAYAAQYKDQFPFVTHKRVPRFQMPDAVYRSPMWAEFSGQRIAPGELLCPANWRYRLNDWNYADFEPVACAYIPPSFLDPALANWVGLTAWQMQRTGDVLFPAQKVSVYEWQSWHTYPGPRGEDWAYLYYANGNRPGSAAYFDGHVREQIPNDSQRVERRPVWFADFYAMTPMGVRGRDR